MLALSKRFRAHRIRVPRGLPDHGQDARHAHRRGHVQLQLDRVSREIGGLINRTLRGYWHGGNRRGTDRADCEPFQPKVDSVPQTHAVFRSIVEDELGIAFDAAGLSAQADFVVNLLPYAPETDHQIDRNALFQGMKPGAFLIHVGSGSTLDESALVEALKSGHLRGAALDTFEYEPLQPDHPLVELARDPADNVILTPHVAAGTAEIDRRADYVEIERYLRGEALRYRIS